jgi:uncharacterized membrane protein YbhN (UPF0104 family)
MDRVTPRSMLLRALFVVALFVALGFLAIQLVPDAGERLSEAEPGWIALGVVLELVAFGGFAWCFAATFSYGDHKVPPARSAEVAIGELAAFAVVPGGVAAPLIRFWALYRGGMPLRTIAVRSVVHAPLLNVPYVAVALLLGIGVATGVAPGDAPLWLALAPIGVIVGSVVFAVAVTFAARSKRLADAERGWRRIARELATIVPDGLREIPGRARRPGAIGGGAIWWGCDCAVLWAAFQAIGTSPPLAVIVLAYMLGLLGTAIPLPGGVGGVEPLMLAVLTASGVATAPATAAIVVYRAIALGMQSTAGAIAVGLLIPSVRAEAHRRAEAQEPPEDDASPTGQLTPVPPSPQ